MSTIALICILIAVIAVGVVAAIVISLLSSQKKNHKSVKGNYTKAFTKKK